MLPVWKMFLIGACVPLVSSWALVVNEVYFRTTASTYRNQWIELYNETGESVDLRQFAIGTGSKQKPLISWREGSGFKLAGFEVEETRLEAGAYALILDRTYGGEEPLEVPRGTIAATVADASLGESVFLRTNDALRLYKKYGAECQMLESLPLSATAHGFSLERIFSGRGAERKNFSHSILLRGKTTSPGRPNTIQGLCEDSQAT
ncbi:MAG: lamin tail domain-containing protein, partial [Spirochaetia bacterium]|nr:lamin tail domain-containing protein [Spirochaetia bacterium]